MQFVYLKGDKMQTKPKNNSFNALERFPKVYSELELQKEKIKKRLKLLNIMKNTIKTDMRRVEKNYQSSILYYVL